MSRRLCNLRNLLTDLEARYGEQDDLVQQVRCELATVEAAESKLQGLSTKDGSETFGPPRRHSWDGLSALPH